MYSCLEAGKHHIPERRAVFVWYEQRAGWVWFLCVVFSGEEFGPNNITWQFAIDLPQNPPPKPQTFYDVVKGLDFLFCF